MKKFLSIIIALSLIMVMLTACNSSKPNSNTVEAPTESI